jgi:hypothetical protein
MPMTAGSRARPATNLTAAFPVERLRRTFET